MNKYLVVAVLMIAIAVVIGCSGSKNLTASYWQPSLQPTDIKTSGYSESTKLSWLVSNDSANLYIKARTADLKTQMNIAKHGLTVYVDTTGKKKKVCSTTFPYQEHGQQMMGPPPAGGPGQQSHLQIVLSKSGNLYFQNGEATYLINTLVEKSSFGAKAEIDPQGVMQWEVKLPLAAIWPTTGYVAGKPFNLGVEVSYGRPDVDFKQMDNGSGVDMQQTSMDPDNRRPIGTVAPNQGIGSGMNEPSPRSNFPTNSGSMPVSSWTKLVLSSPTTVVTP